MFVLQRFYNKPRNALPFLCKAIASTTTTSTTTTSTPHFTPLNPSHIRNPSCSSWPNSFNCLIGLFDKSHGPKLKQEQTHQVSVLKDELIKLDGENDSESLYMVLQEKGLPLFASYSDGSALILLLELLKPFPHLALEVFNWRRKQASFNFPMTPQEYSKGITVAGRARNPDLAYELFTEAVNNRIRTASTYNALMGAYMVNGLSEKCQSLFMKFVNERCCAPTVVTYNILISVFGRLMLINNMEATLQQIYESKLSPNVNTFNSLIAGYLTAWMWDRMENSYRMMMDMSIEPDAYTHLLMIRGYSHAGKIEEMEKMYELVKKDLPSDGISVSIIRCMVCAYCKNSHANRIEKIEELMKLIPEEDYSSWLNVMLINVYAKEILLDRMEKLIDTAFEHHTAVKTVGVMRSIISAYYLSNAVDKLASFVKRAECEGWRICRSLYHCKLVMYGTQNRLEEMENVLFEMKKFNMNITKKTFVIMCKAYSSWGHRCKVEQVAGLMCKLGYGIPLDDCPS